MSEGVFEFEYQPTKREIGAGMGLTTKSVYKGGWRWTLWVYHALEGAAFAALGGVLSYFILAYWGETPMSAFLIWWSLWMLLAYGGMSLASIVRNHMRTVYVHRTLPKQFRVHLSSDGVDFRTAHSSNRTGWADVDDIVRGKGMTVLVTGACGLILPDRLLAQAGDVAELNRMISQWFDVARRRRA